MAGLIRKENRQVSEQTIVYFLNKTGTDMENITKELEKLFCYTFGRDAVTKEDVDAVCVTQITNHIFEMVDAVAQKKQKTALDLYYDLLTLKEPPMRILFLITRQFNLLLQVKELKNKGYDANAIGGKVGLAGFIARKYVTQAARFREEDLRRALTDCVETEEAVKTGRMNDVMSVELLIVKYIAASM